MSFSAIVTMALVLGIVWGGFLYALRLALKKEKEKQNRKEDRIAKRSRNAAKEPQVEEN